MNRRETSSRWFSSSSSRIAVIRDVPWIQPPKSVLSRTLAGGADQVHLQLLLREAATRRPGMEARPQAPLGPEALLCCLAGRYPLGERTISLPGNFTPLTAPGVRGTDSMQ